MLPKEKQEGRRKENSVNPETSHKRQKSQHVVHQKTVQLGKGKQTRKHRRQLLQDFYFLHLTTNQLITLQKKLTKRLQFSCQVQVWNTRFYQSTIWQVNSGRTFQSVNYYYWHIYTQLASSGPTFTYLVCPHFQNENYL